ncbi:YeeE/YedE family protein [Leptotrichia sp. oral taxon 215 str. W9775]|jgi:transporter|uniref:YeeE/YedE thiosulfate transporter family protein n=1 Tax=Leptotrichia sp. oral taxon 215 TaxID=712359 RepID=UPI0003AE127A|nr:YeeE/YedE thiosulfate transporter family protein [Leptotrichia sp. oral taxon 215]ERK65545.1 YeeE/YedE family protein [Leptotrichia sp. oral taxon 215 str. W9775]
MNTTLDKEMTKVVKANSVRKKPFKSQIPHALVLIALLIGLGFYLNDAKLVKYLIFGVVFGMILQRSRFCFTAAFRDPVITGSTSLTRAVFLAIAVGTIGFSALSLYSISTGGKPMGTDSVAPLSILTVIGGVMFGIGMVTAGGCASGTLMRVGEGFQLQWVALLCFMLGSVAGAWAMGFLEPLGKANIKVYLPDHLGWAGALIFQFALIAIVYVLAIKWQKKKYS